MITGHTTHTTSSCEANSFHGYCAHSMYICSVVALQSGRLGVRFMYAALGG